MNTNESLQAALSSLIIQITNFLPNIIAAIVVFVVGIVVGNWAKWGVVKLLEALRVSKIFKGSPVEQFFKKAEIAEKIEHLIGSLVQWFILLIFFIAVVNILGLTTVSAFLNNILGYIPRVISALFILALGIILAGIVESVVKSSVSQINISTGRLASKVSSYIVFLFTVLAALAELGIAQNLINTLFIGIVAMLALGFGLAFGLGSKDLIARILDEWYTNLKRDS